MVLYLEETSFSSSSSIQLHASAEIRLQMSFPPEHGETVCLLINLLKLHCCPLKFSATFLPVDVLFCPVPSFPGWDRAGGEGRVARRQRPQPAEYSGHHHCESFLPSVHLSRLDASFLSQMMTRRPLFVVPLFATRGRQSLVFPRGEGAEAVMLSVVLSSLWV